MRKEISVAVLVGLLWGSAMFAPGAAMKANSSSPKKAAPKVSPARASTGTPGEQGLSYYKAIGERNLFQPIMPEIPIPDTPPPTFVVETPPPPPPPTNGWTYSGYASIDGVEVAILQETASGSAVFLHKGEDFRGGTVDEITPGNMKVTFDGRPITLQKSNEYNVLPLSPNLQQNANAAMPGPQNPSGPPRTFNSPMPRTFNSAVPQQSAYAASIRQRAEEMRRAYNERMRTAGRDGMRGRRGMMNMPPPAATGGAAPLPQPMRPR